MRHNVNYQKPQTAYKIPNSNFPQQLCTFLSQSKHQKQQQYSQINQYMVEQFIHLFQICNINRFIDYTDQFINEIRNVILRLQMVQKKTSQCLDQKDEFMYLIVEGKVKKIKRKKPILAKRVSRFNATGLNFQSNTLMSHFNPRSSHQTFHNLQLKEFQKSIIMDRNSRMSLMNGNLWSQMVSTPKRKNRTQDKNQRGFSSFCKEQRDSEMSVNRTQGNNFHQLLAHQNENLFNNKTCSIIKQKNQYGTQLLQPFEQQVYQCLTPVKYVKLLKWSYDQLVQYVFKYQNDKLIEFLSKSLIISQHDVKFHQVYNKTAFHFYPKKESQHSNMFIGLEKGTLYILRKGSVEMKYQSKSPFIKIQDNSKLLMTQCKNNPNLASYINRPESFYKKVVLNQGAIICPQLQNNTFFIQSLQDAVLIQINNCLLQTLKTQLKGNWWNKKFVSTYEKIKSDRSFYMKNQQFYNKQEIKELKMNNVSIDSSKKFRNGNKQKSRFRAEAKMLNQKQDLIKENFAQTLEDKENTQEDFRSEEYKEFVSLLPYEIMIKSKQKISMKLKQKSRNKNVSNKVFNYLKKNQKGNSSSKYKNKVFELKMKNIASKQIGLKDLQSLQDGINNDEAKKEFHKSLKGNWFKEQTEVSSDPTVNENTAQRASLISNNEIKNILLDKKADGAFRSSIQIGGLTQLIKQNKKRFPSDEVQSIRNYQKKVTFRAQEKDSSSEEQQYLCSDDTGLINKFVQNSHNYQKQLSYLINSSQREEKSQMKHKKKLKTCKTQGSNVVFSHHLINDIIKRVNKSHKKSTILSNKNSDKISNTPSKSHSASEKKQMINLQEMQKKSDNKIKLNEENNPNSFSAILSGMIGKKVEIRDGYEIAQDQINQEQNLKDKKTISYTNNSSVRSSSCKLLKYSNIQSLDRKRTSINMNERKDTYTQSAFFKENIQRPNTAEIPSRQQCHSLFFNQWIETDSGTAEANDHRLSQLVTGNYNYHSTNQPSGDKKIWKRLKSGKIVKKSVNFYNKRNAINTTSTPNKKEATLN